MGDCESLMIKRGLLILTNIIGNNVSETEKSHTPSNSVLLLVLGHRVTVVIAGQFWWPGGIINTPLGLYAESTVQRHT